MHIPTYETYTIQDLEPRVIDRSVAVAACQGCGTAVRLGGPARQFSQIPQTFGSGIVSIKIPMPLIKAALSCGHGLETARLEPADE